MLYSSYCKQKEAKKLPAKKKGAFFYEKIYGGISDSKEETIYLHITAEKGEGTAAFQLQEMTKAELQKAYRESGNGYWK